MVSIARLDDLANLVAGAYAGIVGADASDIPYLWGLVGVTAVHDGSRYAESARVHNQALTHARNSGIAFTPSAASLVMPKNPSTERGKGAAIGLAIHSLEIIMGYVAGRLLASSYPLM